LESGEKSPTNFPAPNNLKRQLSPPFPFRHQPTKIQPPVGKDEFFGIGRPSEFTIKRRLFFNRDFLDRIVFQRAKVKRIFA
jgi:hypothetical protein